MSCCHMFSVLGWVISKFVSTDGDKEEFQVSLETHPVKRTGRMTPLSVTSGLHHSSLKRRDLGTYPVNRILPPRLSIP